MSKMIVVLLLLLFSGIVTAQEGFRYKCPAGNNLLPVSCLESLQVADVNRQLTERERHKLCQLFLKAHLDTRKKYRQDYLLDAACPIYRLFKVHFPEIKRYEGEGGIFLGKIFDYIKSRPEYNSGTKSTQDRSGR